MASKIRKVGARKAVRTKWQESGKHKCAFCHKRIIIGGIKEGGRWYHRTCWNRKKVEETRRKTAIRGHYA